jgi:MtN3 and saliva related transmembrane protein
MTVRLASRLFYTSTFIVFVLYFFESVQNLITNIIGYTATVIGTSIMVPQIIKALKTKRMDDVSSGMVWLYFFNCLLWLTYGLLIGATPVAVANGIGLIVGLVQVWLKLRFGR